MAIRHAKDVLRRILEDDAFGGRLEEIARLPGRRVANPLMAIFYEGDTRTRWRAITAFGIVVATLADQNLEAARILVRRLRWHLNDESGGIGWGAPEALGECLARHPRLAAEYAHLLAAYIQPGGNFLEHPLLQRGLLWGLGRLAHARPGLLTAAAPHVHPFLQSDDPYHRGLGAWVAAGLGDRSARALLATLGRDRSLIRLYRAFELEEHSVAALAAAALAALTP